MTMSKKDPFAGAELRTSLLNKPLELAYRFAPGRLRETLIAIVWRLEGGQLRSATARKLLAKYHGVEVGAFSYGSLLVPGMAQAGTRIGRYASIGPNVRRYNTNHPVDAASLHPYWYNPILGFADASEDQHRTELVIEDDVWIGANVVILPGCTRIGVGAVVGAGAVVTRDVEDFAVVMGLPAKQKSLRLDAATRERLLAVNPWRLGPRECFRELTEISQRQP